MDAVVSLCDVDSVKGDERRVTFAGVFVETSDDDGLTNADVVELSVVDTLNVFVVQGMMVLCSVVES